MADYEGMRTNLAAQLASTSRKVVEEQNKRENADQNQIRIWNEQITKLRHNLSVLSEDNPDLTKLK
ncbi:hypothetical protein M407DRAFT_136632 [Tulasnella calospora MUT 4182]|uniref:Uncharacterized protein n=1 Tax=Tulasnella calospora MUT 4182 TaxID=1051891 RepID=A0A0C3LGB8_9AGAM|nr:hypothetical protein M407DRAFT_136632 [Tulasnella calospora MUT 4182]